MTQHTTHIGRTARRLAMLAVPLLIASTGTAAAHGDGGHGGGVMGGGWGLFDGGIGLWGLVWMGLLLVVSLYVAGSLVDSDSGRADRQPESILRERYARGELSDEEFERRRKRLE